MILLLAALFVGGGVGVVAYGLSRTRIEMVLAPAPSVVDDEEVPAAGSAGAVYRVLEPVLDAGTALMRRVSPIGRLDLIKRRISYAGMEGTLTSERVLAYKAGAAAGGFLLGIVAPFGSFPPLVWALMVAGIASFVPDFWLDSKARERQAVIARDFPEAIDLLSITVEAGLGLEQAMEVVTENLEGPLGAEFTRVLREVELGVSRRAALGNLRERTDVPELSGFIVALVQADQMGAPIAEVLRVQAAQVRLKRRQHAREKAAQAPVKILFPVIFFIFPSLFVVILGPGAIRIFENLIKQ